MLENQVMHLFEKVDKTKTFRPTELTHIVSPIPGWKVVVTINSDQMEPISFVRNILNIQSSERAISLALKDIRKIDDNEKLFTDCISILAFAKRIVVDPDNIPPYDPELTDDGN